MGKKGLITVLIKQISSLKSNEKALAGKTLNVIKRDIVKLIEEKKK